MIPSEVVMVTKPKISGIKTAHEKPKARINRISANAIAINCPRCRSEARIGTTSDLIAGGPVTKAPSNSLSFRAVLNASVYCDAWLRSRDVPMLAYKVPPKAFSCVTSAPGITDAARASDDLNSAICSGVACLYLYRTVKLPSELSANLSCKTARAAADALPGISKEVVKWLSS